MGIFFSKIIDSLFGKRQARIVMIGLDAAGKTTILHKLAFNETVETVPTIGFSLQQVKQGKLAFDVWDIGGQSELRHLWQHYYHDSDALIFVVDSVDTRREEAKQALEDALSSTDLNGVPLLVLANKQDMAGAAKSADVADFLGLALLEGRKWYVQECSALTGKGLIDGLKWVGEAVQEFWKKENKK